jgi:redox-sensitive bicupin YhaK (pirin superfamily)
VIELRRASDRFRTTLGWLDSWHSFNFGHHYDPNEQGHGLLLVNNDDRVRPGTGFGTHGHRDMEIVTWVLEGSLEHRDTTGHEGVLYPGLAQRMSAGWGIQHSETNPSAHEDVHFVQMWVLPDTLGVEPSYEQLDINADLDRGGLVPIASGRGHDAAIHLQQQGAVLWGGRLQSTETVIVPEARHVHVYVARGSAALEDSGPLDEGDAARLTAAGALELTGCPDGAEVLIWATD